jgi:hypothetical protein
MRVFCSNLRREFGENFLANRPIHTIRIDPENG